MTLVLNFTHPLTSEQLGQLGQLLGSPPDVRNITVQIDRTRPLADVAHELIAAAGLASTEWQTLPLVVNPPGLAPLALALIAELHGRCGHFPAMVNMRPVANVTPPRYEVAEIVNLQGLRDDARAER